MLNMKLWGTVVCILFAIGVTQGNVKHSTEKWKEHQRPQHIFSHLDQHSKTKPTERGTTLMKMAISYLRNHPEVIPTVEAMFARIQNIMMTAKLESSPEKSSTFECPDYGRYPCEVAATTASGVDQMEYTDISLVDMWRHLVIKIKDDSAACTECVDFWTVLKGLACDGLPWELIKPIVIEWCSNNLPLEPFVCEGVITIQGEHVYCIVTQADPRNFCESLNNCYPPDTREGRPPVSERTPWAVKARMVEAGTWPPETRSGSRRRRRTPEGDKYIKIATLADIHLQMKHAVGSATECQSDVCCLEEMPGEGSARYWGEYTCNLPLHTLQLFMDRVRGIAPDFVVYAGDSPPHTMYDETESSQLNCSQIVVNAMKESFGPDLRVYPVIGNHEMFPTNLYSRRIKETERMTENFAKIWGLIAGFEPSQNETFADMSYYSMPVPGYPGLRVVGINTELDWYTANFYATLNEHTPENEEHKQWFNDTLRLAKESDEKIILISHHPVGSGSSNVRSARWWEALAVEYGDVIVLHVCGHTHSDELKLTFDPLTMEAVTVNHVAPSTNSKTYVNPSLVMYYLHPTNYTLMDYESFHLEIKDQEQSIGVPPAIVFGYDAREEYNMTDLSPESYKQLLLRFTEDDELFQKYHQNRNSHADPGSYCDYSCRMSTVCNIWFPDNMETNECISLIPPEGGTTTPSVTSPDGETDGAGCHGFNAPSMVIMLIVSFFSNY